MRSPLCATGAAVFAATLLQACASAPVPAYTSAPLLRASDGDGTDPAYAYQLGKLYQQRGQWRQAGAAYARSIALAPHQLDARNAQAALMAGQGQLQQAAALLQQLVEEFPRDAQPRSNLGYVYYLQRDYAAAQRTLEQALALDPAHARAASNLSLVRQALRQPGAASALPAVELSTAPSAAPPTAPAFSGSARMELVQLAPREFRLQTRPAATAPAIVDTAQVQIVNGNGVAGMGERVRQLLQRRGTLDRASVVNQRGHYQRHTIIEYLPGYQQQARSLQASLHGHALALGVRQLPGQTGVRIVLGHDLIAHIATIDGAASMPLAQYDAAERRADLAISHFNQE